MYIRMHFFSLSKCSEWTDDLPRSGRPRYEPAPAWPPQVRSSHSGQQTDIIWTGGQILCVEITQRSTPDSVCRDRHVTVCGDLSDLNEPAATDTDPGFGGLPLQLEAEASAEVIHDEKFNKTIDNTFIHDITEPTGP